LHLFENICCVLGDHLRVVQLQEVLPRHALTEALQLQLDPVPKAALQGGTADPLLFERRQRVQIGPGDPHTRAVLRLAPLHRRRLLTRVNGRQSRDCAGGLACLQVALAREDGLAGADGLGLEALLLLHQLDRLVRFVQQGVRLLRDHDRFGRAG